MMRVSTRARYALRMMLDIARHGGQERLVSLGTVSERTDISRGYLEQVAHSLRSARLLRAGTGRRGGYRLAHPAGEITVGQIFEALNGPTSLVDCIDDPGSCPRGAGCECRVIYRLINSGIVDVLRQHTVADLLDSDWVRANGGLPPVGAAPDLPEGHGCAPVRRDRPAGVGD